MVPLVGTHSDDRVRESESVLRAIGDAEPRFAAIKVQVMPVAQGDSSTIN